MKISVCIPHKNRIEYLLKALKLLENQTYDDLEVVISDNASEDNTKEAVQALQKTFKFPIVYSRNESDMGYDFNLRKTMELASGEYCVILGNDDTFYKEEAVEIIVDFLKTNYFPDVGFVNFTEEFKEGSNLMRSSQSKILGSGEEIALQYYSAFTIVAGTIYKRSWFDKVNTDEYDHSLYSQVFIAVDIMLSGGILFGIHENLVLKDILVDGKHRKSYRDEIPRKWKDYRKMDAGLIALGMGISNLCNKHMEKSRADFYYLKRAYAFTYPNWIFHFKNLNAYVGVVGLMSGLYPCNNKLFQGLNLFRKSWVFLIYLFSTTFSLLIPSVLFMKNRAFLYSMKKRFVK